MAIRIKLVGCARYSYGMKGELFEKGYEYDLPDEKAQTLLQSQNDRGLPFFVRVERPASATVDTVLEEASGGDVGGVRIRRRKAAPVANPKVRTSGDTRALEAEDKHEAPSEEEGVEL